MKVAVLVMVLVINRTGVHIRAAAAPHSDRAGKANVCWRVNFPHIHSKIIFYVLSRKQ